MADGGLPSRMHHSAKTTSLAEKLRWKKMEEELKCQVCSRLFTNPVLLPCTHSMCLACAQHVKVPISISDVAKLAGNVNGISSSSPEDASLSGVLSDVDIDKLSLLSETDSGVVCTSRPNSYVCNNSSGSLFFQHSQGHTFCLTCQTCRKQVYLDENGANSLPKNRALEMIVDKYGESKHLVNYCQLCEGGQNNPATTMCEQCEVFYCDRCRENCHPSRGPLAKHNLVDPNTGKSILRSKNKNKECKCSEHSDENLSMYCMLCKTTVCYLCVQDGRHINHDVQALGAMCKAQKTELSVHLQSLSEKAQSGTEFIQKLKCMADHIEGNSMEFEASVVAQCDSLIEAIKQRKKELIGQINLEKKQKQQIFREQVNHCTQVLQKTTGLLQFSIEVLKENDPAAYLQVSPSLINRVLQSNLAFNKEMELKPRVSSDFELTLDKSSVLLPIQNLGFLQMKEGIAAPGAPRIIPDDCSAENNSVTIAWQPHFGGVVDGYVLELDDGNEGEYREVYCGSETICSVDGLHFDSMYNARVKAFNHAGESDYSEYVCLQTAEVAWFNFDPTNTHPDFLFSNDNMTVTCNSFDDRVVLGTCGFSKGVHYWEITIDCYDNTPDPAFGVARFDVNRELMLGKDEKGWSMYIDSKRSWFMHSGQHMDRTDGGIACSSVIGVLLDLNQHTLCFYVNEEPHGPIAFSGLHGVFYPAISLNRNVQVTLHSGLHPPCDSDTEDE